jgi:hypothetical protein
LSPTCAGCKNKECRTVWQRILWSIWGKRCIRSEWISRD